MRTGKSTATKSPLYVRRSRPPTTILSNPSIWKETTNRVMPQSRRSNPRKRNPTKRQMNHPDSKTMIKPILGGGIAGIIVAMVAGCLATPSNEGTVANDETTPFVSGADKYACYRAPAIAITRTGTAACWRDSAEESSFRPVERPMGVLAASILQRPLQSIFPRATTPTARKWVRRRGDRRRARLCRGRRGRSLRQNAFPRPRPVCAGH